MDTGHNITVFVNKVVTGHPISFRMTELRGEPEVSIPKCSPKASVTALTAVTTRVKSVFTNNGMPIGV